MLGLLLRHVRTESMCVRFQKRVRRPRCRASRQTGCSGWCDSLCGPNRSSSARSELSASLYRVSLSPRADRPRAKSTVRNLCGARSPPRTHVGWLKTSSRNSFTDMRLGYRGEPWNLASRSTIASDAQSSCKLHPSNCHPSDADVSVADHRQWALHGSVCRAKEVAVELVSDGACGGCGERFYGDDCTSDSVRLHRTAGTARAISRTRSPL